ncbi:sarcoplasmic calcium-binding protein-like [Mercenaria mercenaria]|uniref:sarcoplasmic calcium-binding protein-like n=1 Tax=Mercenaria mercenaria TaxID=6596 RepID=UPI00234EE262|nr:sarcoplasmic calcium-binding protein-like [Mercenaria mercenaria]
MKISVSFVAISLILGLSSVLSSVEPSHMGRRHEPSRRVTMYDNDFLITKWKIWYKSLDVNHDGTISIDDVEESRIRFSELHRLEADEKKFAMDSLQIWWNEFIFRRQTGEISEQQFVDSLSQEFMADQAKFCTEMLKWFGMIFAVIDTNKDLSISEDEFLIALNAYGHGDVALNLKFFKAYKPTDGLIHLRDIVISWVDFVASTNNSAISIVKEAFEAGV